MMHSEICAIPSERLETERGLLAELPSLWPSFGARPTARKVDKLSCVRFGSARYSVPSKLIGSIVTLLVSEGQVQVVEPFTGEVLAEHRLIAPEENGITDDHYGSSRPDKPRRGARARAQTEKQFLALGDIADASSPALPRPG